MLWARLRPKSADFHNTENRHRYDYASCKGYLEYLFAMGALSKTKILSTVSHRQSAGASPWEENWASKLPAAIGIRLCNGTLRGDTSSLEMCDESVQNLSTNLLRRLSGEFKFTFISNQLQKEVWDI
ncbi:hypothetical protein TNCV_3281261 [Trichonephila clavipes]|nr:hypothetical protein TNCV_3281261 [Trichonephila clavipes]